MKITELAIRRPAATTMVIMFFVVLGLFGYTKIGSDLFPESEVPFVTVVTQYPGAGPAEMETQVVNQIEEAVSSINGLKSTRSWIYEGRSITLLEFRAGTPLNVAGDDAQKAIDQAAYRLPMDMDKPVIAKHDMNAAPVMVLALAGDQSLNQIYDFAKDKVKSRLETLPGVAAIDLVGGLEAQVRVDVHQGKLVFYGVSVNQIVQLLQAENLTVPGGSINTEQLEYDVRLLGKFKTIADIQNLPVPLPAGGTVPLREIATVTNSFAEIEQASRLNGQNAVFLTIQKQSGVSLVETAKGIRAELAALTAEVPAGMKIIINDDNSVFIDNSLADTKRTLLEGVLMTGLVLLFFLRQWRSLSIVMLAIPTSIFATFMMIYFFGFTFNLLSLMGLSLCVGILVDDSIVVLENIDRHLKMGKGAIQAAIDGRAEIGMAAIAITLSDVVVFGPIAFMQGMVGQFFRQFGLTVVAATLFSLFVSFTLTPMLSARFYHAEPDSVPLEKKKGLWTRLGQGTGNAGEKVLFFYRRLLLWSLQHRLKLLGLTVAGVIGALALIPVVGFEFMSQSDQGKFTISIETPSGSRLPATDAVAADLEKQLLQLPEVADVALTEGQAAGGAANIAELNVILKPKNERQKTVWQMADMARVWAKAYPGTVIEVREAQIVGLNEFEAPIVMEISGSDSGTLQDLALRLKGITEKTPGTSDVSMSWSQTSKPEYQVVIDRWKTSQAGLTAGDVALALRSALAGSQASKITLNNKEMGIWVQLTGLDRKNADDIGNIAVINRLGETFLVKEIADIQPGRGPAEIRHKNRDRMISVLASYNGASLSQIKKSLDAGIVSLQLPNGYKVEYDGMIKQMSESNADLGQALALSLILVYMVLVILYESFLTPLIRMLSLPVGFIGGMLALYLTGNTLNMLSIIGIIMLDGLAAKNGTLLIDYTHTLMKQGMPLRDALLEAGSKRLRPIFMTSTTMIFGMLPTALALADGAEIRRPMAVVLIGGLLTSTLLTPLLIPVAYTLLDDGKKWLQRKRRGQIETEQGIED